MSIATYVDPDAAPSTRRIWRGAGWAYALAGWAGGPGLIIGAVAAWSGAGWGWPLLAVGLAVAAGTGGWLLRRRTPRTHVVASHLTQVPTVRDDDVHAGSLQGAVAEQQRLADALQAMTTDLGEVTASLGQGSTTDRVAFLAALDLLRAVRSISDVAGGTADDADEAMAEVRTLHGRVADVVDHLQQLHAMMISAARVTNAEQARRDEAMAELGHLTEWVAQRQRALAELGDQAGQDPSDGTASSVT